VKLEEYIWSIGGKPEGKKPLRKLRRRLVDNIEMHLK
jgi:hypothetical protein